MSDESTPAMLALYLLDLRAQYELELRLLTRLQRLLEEFRGAEASEPRRHTYVGLEQQMKALRSAHRTIDDALAGAEQQLEACRPPALDRRSSDRPDRRATDRTVADQLVE
jgi:hypothetical protein